MAYWILSRKACVTLEIVSAPGQGTVIRARFPDLVPEVPRAFERPIAGQLECCDHGDAGKSEQLGEHRADLGRIVVDRLLAAPDQSRCERRDLSSAAARADRLRGA